jgi:hypothetical protein
MICTDIYFINDVIAREVARTRTRFRGSANLALVLYTLHTVLWIVHPEERMELKRAKPGKWASNDSKMTPHWSKARD